MGEECMVEELVRGSDVCVDIILTSCEESQSFRRQAITGGSKTCETCVTGCFNSDGTGRWAKLTWVKVTASKSDRWI
jgi:hypothetical protein